MSGEPRRGAVRVMLVDDHVSFRQPLAFMLEREPDLEVVAQVGSISEAREVLAREGPEVDLAVVDLDLPDGDGTGILLEMAERRPGARALVLSAHAERGRTARAIEAGAAGVMHKSARISDIVEAVRRLHAGESLISQRETIEALRLVGTERRRSHEARMMIARLTPREKEVLQALAEGLSDKEIAEKLYVGVGTVRTHMAGLLSKLEVDSRLQALVFGVRHGLVKIDRRG